VEFEVCDPLNKETCEITSIFQKVSVHALRIFRSKSKLPLGRLRRCVTTLQVSFSSLVLPTGKRRNEYELRTLACLQLSDGTCTTGYQTEYWMKKEIFVKHQPRIYIYILMSFHRMFWCLEVNP